jgi:hypothetical protein
MYFPRVNELVTGCLFELRRRLSRHSSVIGAFLGAALIYGPFGYPSNSIADPGQSLFQSNLQTESGAETEDGSSISTLIDQRFDPYPILKPPPRLENRVRCQRDSDCGAEQCEDRIGADTCPVSATLRIPGCIRGFCQTFTEYQTAESFCLGNTLVLNGRCTPSVDLDGRLHWLLGDIIDCGEPPVGFNGPTCQPVQNPQCESQAHACVVFSR